MSFREINHKNNEEYWERLELVMERIEAVSEEEASSVEELYRGYFFEMSELFLVLYKLAEASLSGKLAEISTLEGKRSIAVCIWMCRKIMRTVMQTRHMPSVRWAGNTDRCSRHWMPDCMEFIPAVWKEISVICVFMRNCLWKFTTVLRMHRI